MTPPEEDVLAELKRLRLAAGAPSLRAIAARAGTSHTTVTQLYAGSRAPGLTSWAILAAVASALGATASDLHHLQDLHQEAVTAHAQARGAPVRVALLSGPKARRPWEFTQVDCPRAALAALCTEMSLGGWAVSAVLPGRPCTVLFTRPAGGLGAPRLPPTSGETDE